MVRHCSSYWQYFTTSLGFGHIPCVFNLSFLSPRRYLQEWVHSLVPYSSPINLVVYIIHEIIYKENPSMSKKEVLPYGILITKICQRVGVVFPTNASFLKPMGHVNTFSQNHSKGQTSGTICLSKKVCRPRKENIVSKDNTTLVLGYGVLD